MPDLEFPRRELSLEQTLWRISRALGMKFGDTAFMLHTESIGGESIIEISYKDGPKRSEVYNLARQWGCKSLNGCSKSFIQEDGPLTITPFGLEVIYSTAFIFVDRFHTLPKFEETKPQKTIRSAANKLRMTD